MAVDLSDADHSIRRRLIPGERQPGMLTTFGAPASTMRIIPDAPATMDAVTIAEYQREGGGAPSQRRPARERPWGKRPGRAPHP
jgi:hypothetical protein